MQMEWHRPWASGVIVCESRNRVFSVQVRYWVCSSLKSNTMKPVQQHLD